MGPSLFSIVNNGPAIQFLVVLLFSQGSPETGPTHCILISPARSLKDRGSQDHQAWTVKVSGTQAHHLQPLKKVCGRSQGGPGILTWDPHLG